MAQKFKIGKTGTKKNSKKKNNRKKIVNLNFRAKNQWFVLIFIHWYSITFWIFAQKLSKFDYFQFFDNSVFDQNSNFWPKNPNHLDNFFIKNSWLFYSKNSEFCIFLKIEFLEKLCEFLTVWYKIQKLTYFCICWIKWPKNCSFTFFLTPIFIWLGILYKLKKHGSLISLLNNQG